MVNEANQPNGQTRIHPVLKAILNFITIVVIYSNLAYLFNYLPLRLQLPVPRVTHFLFDIYTVFSTYQTFNRDNFILVLLEDEGMKGSQKWIKLDTDEYFPYKKGDQIRRINANMHGYYFGKNIYNKTLGSIAAKILSRYNYLNPLQPASKVIVGIEWWPRSREAYYTLKKPVLTRYKTIVQYP